MYKKLDELIIDAIKNGKGTLEQLMVGSLRDEVYRIAEAARREEFRVLDGRLTALKKRGEIKYICRKWCAV